MAGNPYADAGSGVPNTDFLMPEYAEKLPVAGFLYA